MSKTRQRQRVRSAADWRARHIKGHPSKIVSDPELRRYVDRLLPRHTFVEIAERCRARFGPERAPSRSSVSRYWRRREGLG